MKYELELTPLKASALRVLDRNKVEHRPISIVTSARNFQDRKTLIKVALKGLPMSMKEAERELTKADIEGIETGDITTAQVRHFLVWRCFYMRKINFEQLKAIL